MTYKCNEARSFGLQPIYSYIQVEPKKSADSNDRQILQFLNYMVYRLRRWQNLQLHWAKTVICQQPVLQLLFVGPVVLKVALFFDNY